jgi:hypothetical protein
LVGAKAKNFSLHMGGAFMRKALEILATRLALESGDHSGASPTPILPFAAPQA